MVVVLRHLYIFTIYDCKSSVFSCYQVSSFSASGRVATTGFLLPSLNADVSDSVQSTVVAKPSGFRSEDFPRIPSHVFFCFSRAKLLRSTMFSWRSFFVVAHDFCLVETSDDCPPMKSFRLANRFHPLVSVSRRVIKTGFLSCRLSRCCTDHCDVVHVACQAKWDWGGFRADYYVFRLKVNFRVGLRTFAYRKL
ncbi:hypothetical protein GCK72_012241 [Caenorhabditis remanei]|uniref:Uncharacterized protein n=1 Tax=Caenorhabditis remanei TaxID=31234 RepID=A0A6A5GMC0_CAERE|nr:hypothetical protein GCK72_012241 [Caenorhabditis remanei]KAF1755791.1 hypothetical protein GCK72_012241 [Caenorhabditis remanei]